MDSPKAQLEAELKPFLDALARGRAPGTEADPVPAFLLLLWWQGEQFPLGHKTLPPRLARLPWAAARVVYGRARGPEQLQALGRCLDPRRLGEQGVRQARLGVADAIARAPTLAAIQMVEAFRGAYGPDAEADQALAEALYGLAAQTSTSNAARQREVCLLARSLGPACDGRVAARLYAAAYAPHGLGLRAALEAAGVDATVTEWHEVAVRVACLCGPGGLGEFVRDRGLAPETKRAIALTAGATAFFTRLDLTPPGCRLAPPGETERRGVEELCRLLAPEVALDPEAVLDYSPLASVRRGRAAGGAAEGGTGERDDLR